MRRIRDAIPQDRWLVPSRCLLLVHGKKEAFLDLAFETGNEVQNGACIHRKAAKLAYEAWN